MFRCSTIWEHLPEADLQLGSFEDLAMPLFEQLYNFAQWVTLNQEGAEDLVQETYAKAQFREVLLHL